MDVKLLYFVLRRPFLQENCREAALEPPPSPAPGGASREEGQPGQPPVSGPGGELRPEFQPPSRTKTGTCSAKEGEGRPCGWSGTVERRPRLGEQKGQGTQEEA
jgi:hypothetical protein